MNNLILLTSIISLVLPTKKALHMFQQNRYELSRYTMWLKDWLKNNQRKVLKAILLWLSAFLLALFLSELLAVALILYYSLHIAYLELEKKYIKPLVYTARVYRQILTISTFYAIVLTIVYIMGNSALMYFMLFSPFISYVSIYVMHLFNNPIENIIKKGFKNDAKNILKSRDDLIKIGITGSYGKTSSKNILQAILSEQFYSLASPASFNTPMGLTITIRQDLKRLHEVFIAEMGADKVGDIVELSNFIQPDMAIVTAIGPQHLATFKSIENIIKEKMALIEGLPSDGVAIINKDNKYINEYKIKNDCQVFSYGIKNKGVDFLAYDINYSIKGSSFKLKNKEDIYYFETRLLGEHNVLNILAAIALARSLKMDWDKLIKAVRKIKYVSHRLELKKINGLQFIDNAFNSNPEGAKMSLKVISQMPNKRYVVTPGMIDLGKIQAAENKKFGQYMKGCVDFVVLVGENQTKPIYEGLKESGFNLDNVKVFDTVKEALNFIYTNATVEDIILLENDLPDAFSN